MFHSVITQNTETGMLLLDTKASIPSSARYGITLTILPGVFHPGYFLSTNLLIDFLSATDLNGKRLLELGAGSGLVSFYAAKNGSIVTATDINPVALEGLQKNALANELPITVLKADLLEGISADAFDCIVINPPYYPKNPENVAEAAFYCGEDFDYFKRLFSQLGTCTLPETTSVYMILSEDCRISQIFSLAHREGILEEQVFETRRRGERNMIYRLRKQ